MFVVVYFYIGLGWLRCLKIIFLSKWECWLLLNLYIHNTPALFYQRTRNPFIVPYEMLKFVLFSPIKISSTTASSNLLLGLCRWLLLVVSWRWSIKILPLDSSLWGSPKHFWKPVELFTIKKITHWTINENISDDYRKVFWWWYSYQTRNMSFMYPKPDWIYILHHPMWELSHRW